MSCHLKAISFPGKRPVYEFCFAVLTIRHALSVSAKVKRYEMIHIG